MLRVTGRVTRAEAQSGTKVNQSTGEARLWQRQTFRVLVAEQDVVTVSHFVGSNEVPLSIREGDQVDWAVSTRVGRGNLVEIAYDRDFPSAIAAAAPSLTLAGKGAAASS